MNGLLDIHPKVVGGALGLSTGNTAVWILSLMHVHATLPQALGLVSVIGLVGGWLAPILTAEKTAA